MKLKEQKQETSNVQFAQPEDIAALVALGYKNHKEYECSLPEPNLNKVTEIITHTVVDGVPLVYKDDEGKILGCFLMREQDANWWTTEPIMVAYLFYVTPNNRASRVAVELLRAAKEYQETISNTPIGIGLMGTQESMERKGKLLKRFGFRPFNFGYVLTSQTSAETE